MWTGDGRVFFYNPSTRTSVWEKPEELAKRTDVDKMTANPPDTLANNNNSSGGTLPTKQEVLKSPGKTKRASDDSDSEAEDETPAKKSKKEDTPRKLH